MDEGASRRSPAVVAGPGSRARNSRSVGCVMPQAGMDRPRVYFNNVFVPLAPGTEVMQ